MSGDKPENNEEKVIAPTISASKVAAPEISASHASPEPDKKPKKEKTQGRGALVLAFFAFLIALAAAALAAWMYWQDYQLATAKTQTSNTFQSEIAELSAAQNEMNAAFATQREAMSQLRSDNGSQYADLNRRSQDLELRVQSLATVDRRDWLLAEVEYLLRLANQRAQLSHDARAAAKLLSSADSILKELDDSALYPVRAQLAKEIGALQSSADVDVEGVYLALQALVTQAGKLRLFQAPSYEPEVVETVSEDWQGRLQSGLGRAWDKLRSYIRISHHQENFQLQLAPEQELALRTNLQLMFEQAQMAVLANRPLLYQRALDKAATWLDSYYQLDSHRDALLEQIAQLKATPVGVEVADISGSMRSLKEYLKASRWQKEVRK
jgi:uroporphyrin-3 C-methyltransferase